MPRKFPVTMEQPNIKPPKANEVDEVGWAAFKEMEAPERVEYAKSDEARKDHEDWLNAPMAFDNRPPI